MLSNARAAAETSLHPGFNQRERHTARMSLTQHNPDALFPPYVNYAHAVEVAAGS